MRRLLQIFGALILILILISVCAFPMAELGRGHFFYFAASLFFAGGVYFGFSRSKRFKKNALFVTLATTVSLFAGYCALLKTINNVELAEFFQTGSSCKSVLEIIPIKNIQFIVETSENVCSIVALKQALKNAALDDARRKISAAATLLKSHQRLHTTEMTLLLAINVSIYAKPDRIKYDQEKRSLHLTEDMINLLEIYPLPSTSQGIDSIGFLAEENRKIERKLFVTMTKSISKIFASRTPASSVTRTVSIDEWTTLKLRVKKVQSSWNITDADLKN